MSDRFICALSDHSLGWRTTQHALPPKFNTSSCRAGKCVYIAGNRVILFYYFVCFVVPLKMWNLERDDGSASGIDSIRKFWRSFAAFVVKTVRTVFILSSIFRFKRLVSLSLRFDVYFIFYWCELCAAGSTHTSVLAVLTLACNACVRRETRRSCNRIL